MQNKKFIFLLVAFFGLYGVSDSATKGLQFPSGSVADCIDLIECLKATFTTFRENSDGDLEKIIRLTDDLMTKNDVHSWDIANYRKRKTAI